MARVRLFDFVERHKGLWISGPRDRTPPDALRRARGLNAIRERQLRSRNGSTADAAIAAAHSLFRFDNVRFQGATTVLYRNAVSISTGFDGTPLHFAQSNPRFDTDLQYLFVAGGGKLEKVDTTGTAVDVTYANTTIAFVDSNPDTITDSSNQFVSQGFIAGQRVNVSGSASNDDTYEIASVAAGTLTLVATDTLVAEGAGASITLHGIPSVTKWGIAAPSSGPWATEGEDDDGEATPGDSQTKVLDSFDDVVEAGTTGWQSQPLVALEGQTVTQVAATDTPTGTTAVQTTVTESQTEDESGHILTGGTVGRFVFSKVPLGNPIDLNVINAAGDTSSNEDLIAFYFQMDRPEVLIDMTVGFTTGAVVRNFIAAQQNDGFRFKLLPGVDSAVAGQSGIADIASVIDNQSGVVSGQTFQTATDQAVANESMARAYFTISPLWQRITIPKSLFKMDFDGRTTVSDWSGITLIFFILNLSISNQVQANYTFRWDALELVGGGKASTDATGDSPGRTDGGGGMVGTYKYKITFRNSVTGNRSNGSPGTMVARDVQRGFVELTNIPVSSDPQVDQREIWRTVGGGTNFFKIGEINDNLTTTWTDHVADSGALDGTAAVPSTPEDLEDPETIDFSTIEVMSSLELPEDNDPPDADFDDVVISKATAFWTSSGTGKRGRVYFSPLGRPESKRGFITVTGDDDPIQRLVVWSGITTNLFAFSEAKVFEIRGSDPYTAVEVQGIPGVLAAQRRTVVPTSIGIIYQSHDGIRLFNGRNAPLAVTEPLAPLFRGEAAENLTAFEGTVATFARDEYTISDGSQCLGLSLTAKSWRDLGYSDITALYFEPDTNKIQAGRTSNVQLIDDEGTTTDAGTGIPIAWESSAAQLQDSTAPRSSLLSNAQVSRSTEGVFWVDDFFVETDTSSVSITPTIVHKAGTLALTAVSTSARATSSQEINRLFQVPSLRFTGTASSQVTLYNTEFEMRQLSLGLRRTDNNARGEVPGKAPDLATEIEFEIDPSLPLLDELTTLFYVERILFESNTGGTSITPIIDLENTSVTLATFSTTSRSMTEISVERLGPVTGVRLQADFTTNIQLFKVELVIRPLFLEVSVLGGSSMLIDGKAVDPTTAIVFDVDPFFRQYAGELMVPVVDRLTLEGSTASVAVSSTVELNEGVSLTGPTINTSTRQQRTLAIDRIGRVISVTLSADFVTSAVSIYSAELIMRPLPLTITFLREER